MVFKQNIDGTWPAIPWASGVVDKQSIGGGYVSPIIKVKILDGLDGWNTDIPKTTDAAILATHITFTDLLTAAYSSVVDSLDLQFLTRYRVTLSDSTFDNFWDTYIFKELFIHPRTPYKTWGDFYKAILQTTSSFLICAPNLKGYIAPIQYDGTVKNVITRDSVIDLSFENSAPPLNLDRYQRMNTTFFYADELYQENKETDNTDLTVYYPFPVAIGVDNVYTNVLGTWMEITSSIFSNASTNLIKANSVYSYDEAGNLNQSWGTNFVDIAVQLYYYIYRNQGFIHKIKTKGIQTPWQQFQTYEDIPAFAGFSGKAYRCRKYSLYLKENYTEAELYQASDL